jgi:hypothetical protein
VVLNRRKIHGGKYKVVRVESAGTPERNSAFVGLEVWAQDLSRLVQFEEVSIEHATAVYLTYD